MKILTSMMILGGVLFAASPLFAATYEYVDINGNVRVETAETAAEAILSAPQIAPHSGVMRVSENVAVKLSSLDKDTEVYAYVSNSGKIEFQVAESPMEAIELAPNRSENSGVILVIR